MRRRRRRWIYSPDRGSFIDADRHFIHYAWIFPVVRVVSSRRRIFWDNHGAEWFRDAADYNINLPDGNAGANGRENEVTC